MSAPETPPAFGPSLFSADLKTSPLDFDVKEIFDIELEGSGEHLYLYVEKTGVNTTDVAAMLERAYSVSSKEIGFCGMKDRQAVTRQWFSIQTHENAEASQAIFVDHAATGQQVTIVSSDRHSRKLRRGAHRGNEFSIVLRNLKFSGEEDQTHVNQRASQIAEHGFPNYLGPQRFGFNGQNLVRARQWFRKPRKRTSRQQRSLWLSAARSALFNEVCAARVSAGTWDSLLPGEPAILSGSRSFFATTDVEAEELAGRLATFDIHPSAPWWGRGKPVSQDACAEFEATTLAAHDDLREGLEKAGLPQERRAMRAMAQGLVCEWLDDQTLQLRFSLAPGVFATTLLEQLGNCQEPKRDN